MVFVAAACASQATELTSAKRGSAVDAAPGTLVNTDPNASIAIVMTSAGLAGVPVGSNVPRWVVAGAVAAPDGSAVYATENQGDDVVVTQFWRIDPRTGAKTDVGRWVVPGGHPVEAFAVEPGGARVALASFNGDRTLILPFDPAEGGPTAKPSFEGHLEPEAFSIDRQRVFAARSYGDHYRVTTLDLATAEQWPTGSYDKTAPPEDMYGNVVQAVLTPDRTRLATLYRDPQSSEHPAFVHLLDLQSGITVCVDLMAPFGTGGPATDALRMNADGTITVGHRDPGASNGVSALIDPNAIFTSAPLPHYHAEAQPDTDPPSVPDGVADTPGFVRFVALAA